MDIKRTVRSYIVIASALALTACFQKPKQEDTPNFSALPSLTPVYKQISDSYIRVTSPCQGMQTIKIVYSSALTPSNTVKANCVNDQLDVNLPVTEGTTQQNFSLEFKGFKNQKYTKAILSSLNWNPMPAPVSGFAITSGGGTPASSAGASLANCSIGEIWDPSTQTGGAVVLSRTGFQGVIDP